MRAGDCQAIWFQNSRLFSRDKLQRRTQVLGVVQRDVGDDLDAKVHHVGRIQPAPQADLADEQVDAGPGEIVERSRGQDLELGGLPVLNGYPVKDRLQFGKQGGKVIVGDRLLVDLDPLRVGDEMRFGHQPDPVASRLQDRGEHGADRPLPVGPGDMNTLEEVVRIAHCLEQSLGPAQPELHAKAPQRIQPGERLRVVHTWPRCWR